MYYMDEDQSYLEDADLIGKWMIFPTQIDRAELLCKKAVEDQVVHQAKHSLQKENGSYLCCFYIDINDFSAHEKFIQYFMKNDYLPRNKNGNYTNIAFKLDIQTALDLYGSSFKATLHLNDFIDVSTGEWTEAYYTQKSDNEKLLLINKKVHEYQFPGRPLYYLSTSKYGSCYTRLNKEDIFDYEYVRASLEEQNITIKDLSEKLDIGSSAIRNWLKGKSRPCLWYVYAMIVFYDLDENIVLKKSS